MIDISSGTGLDFGPKRSPSRSDRMGRRRKRDVTCEACAAPALRFERAIPAYELLSEHSLNDIETQADWILREIGIEFRGDDTALSLFKNAGASVSADRVRFDTGHVRQMCTSAPERFELCGRDADHTVTLGGKHIVLMPGYGSPFVTDLDKGRRYATLEDFRNFVRLAYASPWLHHSGGTVCEPVDIPVNKRHLDMVLAHLTLSKKPFMGSVTSAERAHDSIEMARIVHGHEFVSNNAVVQANINVNSPLVYDDTMSGALRVYAGANQSVAISPAIFGGAMGPLTPAAIAAQTLAEGMVGIALAQLVQPGCPCVFGSFHSTMNLKSGALTFGSPEANLVTLALGQLGRRLGVPVRSGGGQITASNSADGQAMQDSTSALWATLMSGAHQVWHAAGWLEGGLTMSYEKFVMDLDHCGAMLRMLGGFNTVEEEMGRDAYQEAGPGKNFLSTSHTLRHFRAANYQPDLPESGPFETWVESGSMTSEQKANIRWKEMLEAYEKPEMDASVEDALTEFVTKRKAEMEDAWY